MEMEGGGMASRRVFTGIPERGVELERMKVRSWGSVDMVKSGWTPPQGGEGGSGKGEG